MAQNLHEFLLRLKALFLKRRMDRDMADELAFHQAMLQSKLLRQACIAERTQMPQPGAPLAMRVDGTNA